MNQTQDVELRMRRDAVFMKTEQGIVFRGKQGVFTLKGATVYNTFRELLPLLDGKTKRTEVLNTFAAARRSSVGNLLQALQQRGVVHDAPLEETVILPSSVAEAFDPQIEFLRHYADRPAERFARFREARILLTGSGNAFASAGAALLRNGLRNLRVPKGADQELLWLEAERLNKQNVPCSVLPCSVEESESDVDWVLYCSETPSLGEIFRQNRQAVAGKYRFLPAFIYSGGLFVGPFVARDSGPCWQCAMMRWSDNAEASASRDLWRTIALDLPGTSDVVSEVPAQMLGNTAALEIFKLCAGVPEGETRSRVLSQDLNTLESSIREILPHPQCGLCKPPLSPFSTTPELTQWAKYQGHEFGVFRAFDDEHIEQIPLRISTLPFGQQRTIGWSVEDSADARLQALKKAIVIRSGNQPGTGIGATQEQAEQSALLALGSYKTVAGLAHQSLSVRPWRPEPDSSGKMTAYLIATVTRMNQTLPVVWLAEPLPGVVAAFFSLSGQTACPAHDLLIGTGFSEADAVNAVLSERIARAQMEFGGLKWDDVPREDGRYRLAYLRWSECDAVSVPEQQVSFVDITPKDIGATGTFRVAKAQLS